MVPQIPTWSSMALASVRAARTCGADQSSLGSGMEPWVRDPAGLQGLRRGYLGI